MQLKDQGFEEKYKDMSEIILGIESSCDDTSAAVIKDGYLLSNVLASQDVHKAESSLNLPPGRIR